MTVDECLNEIDTLEDRLRVCREILPSLYASEQRAYPQHYLRDTRCYLSGPIEHGAREDWRKEVKDILRNQFKVRLFDPFEDPKQKQSPALLEARKNRDFEKIREIAKPFVRKDLNVVDRSDFVISYLPYMVPTCGTHHEIILSNEAKKPVLLICPEGREFIPLWYYGFIPDEFMFGSWKELYQYLESVDRGEHKANDRWWFVYGLI